MLGMKLRRTLAIFGMLSVLGGPVLADAIKIETLSQFLNDLTTAQGNFTQINPDDSISTGRIFIHRPGRMRFEYDPPDPALVMAGGGQVAIFDGKSNEPPQQFPLKRTPLSVILARDVDLLRQNMIADHSSDGPTTTIRVQDPENPEVGYIELVFTDNPVELRQWIIWDDVGSKTTVILGDMERDIDLAASLFSVQREIMNREGRN